MNVCKRCGSEDLIHTCAFRRPLAEVRDRAERARAAHAGADPRQTVNAGLRAVDDSGVDAIDPVDVLTWAGTVFIVLFLAAAVVGTWRLVMTGW